jgi:iron complex outermembrane receptor protein
MRFAANVVRRDGFTTSLNTGQELDDRHREAYRLGLNFTPTDWLESYFMLQDTRSNEASTGTVLIAFNPNIPQFNTGPTGAGRLAITGICGALNPGNPGGRADCIDTRVARMNTLVSSLVAEEARVRAGGDDAIRHNQTALRGGVSSHTQQILNITSAEAGEASFLGEVTVKNIFSTTRTRGYPILREIGGSPVPHGVVYNQYDLVGGVPAVTKRSSGREDFMDNFTEEFQILGSINDRHNWILGYYLEEVHDDLAYPALFASFGNVFSASLDTPGLTGVLNGDSVTVLKGYFGQFTADLSDWLLQGLRFTGGYRWSESHFRFTNLGIVPTAAGLVPGPNPVPGPAVNDQAPSWNVSFDYQFDPALMVYLAHRRGFKPGGRNIVPPSIPGARQTFAPETLDDIEFGVKYDWRLGDRAARTNLSLYKQWYADIQRREVVQNPLPPFETVTQVNNLASADIEGLELENVLQLTDRLTLSFNYAYINAEYSKWPGVALVNGQAIPLVKSPYVGTPEHQGSIGVRYRLPVPEAIGELTAAADYFRQTDVWLNDQALQDGFVASKQDGYGNLNLRLDWANVGGHPVDAAVFVRNATDDVHLISSGSLYTNLGVIVGVYNEPRTWGAELRYRFGE